MTRQRAPQPFQVGAVVVNTAARNCHNLPVGTVGECIEIGKFDSEFGLGWSCTIRVGGKTLERASTGMWALAAPGAKAPRAPAPANDRITFPDGELDEICLTDVAHVHLERMDDGHIWIGLTSAEGHSLHINLATRRGAYIVGRVIDHPDEWPGVAREGEDTQKPWEARK